jgi:hypothetical protein
MKNQHFCPVRRKFSEEKATKCAPKCEKLAIFTKFDESAFLSRQEKI